MDRVSQGTRSLRGIVSSRDEQAAWRMDERVYVSACARVSVLLETLLPSRDAHLFGIGCTLCGTDRRGVTLAARREEI